jgi:hypothetical protein
LKLCEKKILWTKLRIEGSLTGEQVKILNLNEGTGKNTCTYTLVLNFQRKRPLEKPKQKRG